MKKIQQQVSIALALLVLVRLISNWAQLWPGLSRLLVDTRSAW